LNNDEKIIEEKSVVDKQQEDHALYTRRWIDWWTNL